MRASIISLLLLFIFASTAFYFICLYTLTTKYRRINDTNHFIWSKQRARNFYIKKKKFIKQHMFNTFFFFDSNFSYTPFRHCNALFVCVYGVVLFCFFHSHPFSKFPNSNIYQAIYKVSAWNQ